jgi:hypothetical protein
MTLPLLLFMEESYVTSPGTETPQEAGIFQKPESLDDQPELDVKTVATLTVPSKLFISSRN